MNKLILDEATVNDAAELEAEADKKAAEAGLDDPIDADKGQIESALNDALATAKRQMRLPEGERDWPAVLFIGEPGSGKTARIKAWAKRRGITLYGVQASTMEEVDLNGPVVMDQDEKGRKFATRLASVEFDKLERPNSVLFLDEFNRARGGVRGTLLTLINDHMIPDAREDGGMRLLKNMLFTVAAINPDETSDDVEPLGQAEHDRFRHIRIISDKKQWLRYIQDRLQHLIEAEEADGDHEAAFADERRKALITKLVSDKRFAFDETADIQKAKDNEAWNKISLNNRNLTKLLDNCDGTKADFLAKWNEFCNNLRKPKVETILDDYEDIEDKANDVFKSDSESAVFGSHKKSAYEKLKAYMNNL